MNRNYCYHCKGFDVAVVGGGPAGSSLALRLARRGLGVALLDAGRFPRDKLCGEFLSPEGVEALLGLGLGSDLEQLGAWPIDRVRLTTPRGRVLDAPLGGRDGPSGLGLSRSALDHRLVVRCREAGVEILEGFRVGGPIIEGGRVVGVVGRVGEVDPVAIRATVVVAADGRHSPLVRQTGRSRPRGGLRPPLFGLKRHLLVAPEDLAEPPGAVVLHLVPGGYVGTCRVERGRMNLCGLLPDSLARRHRGNLDGLAAETFRRNPALHALWEAVEPIGPWKTVAGVRVEVSRPTVAGILYAGDCQGTIDPLGGQGMTMALLGAQGLSPFVVEAVRRGGAGVALQGTVQAAWRRRFDRRVRLCRMFHHILVNPALIDVASIFGRPGASLLAAGYSWTRDPGSADDAIRELAGS